MKRGTGVLILAMALCGASASDAELLLTSCGAMIPAGERGVLQNDVTCVFRCSSDPSIVCGSSGDELCDGGNGYCEPEHFLLERGATLDLNGHTVHMAYQGSGAVCGRSDADRGRCIVRGPGKFAGNKGTAVSSRYMDLVVENLAIDFCNTAIRTGGRVTARGVEIIPGRENTIRGARGVTLQDTHLDGDSGVYSEGDIRVENVEIGPHGGGLYADGAVRGRDLLVQGWAFVNGRDLVLRRVTTVPESGGFLAPVLSARRRLRLADSQVHTIESGWRPVLVRSTCEISEVYGTTSSWGVCSED
jgi:hypothetical protein